MTTPPTRRSALEAGVAAAAAALSLPALRPAAAQGRRETLLLISENPPNSTDIHGVGANRPAYEARWARAAAASPPSPACWPV
jgi:peptide/nickel transport system substrate-binding protein